MLFGNGQSLETKSFTVLKYFLAVWRIFFLLDNVTIGKINFPFFFKYFFETLKTSLTKKASLLKTQIQYKKIRKLSNKLASP